MKSFLLLVMQLYAAAITVQSQNIQNYSLNIGDPAPPIKVRYWLKGKPFQEFANGTVYVVEFWATWCRPCKAAMPHLSNLAEKYSNKVKIIGINIHETRTTSIKEVKDFVDKNEHLMNYNAAIGDSIFMALNWLEHAGEQNNGIPKTFVVDANGKIAWIGHPKDIDEVLPKIVNNSWDINEALAKRNFNRYLTNLDDSLYYEIIPYLEDNRYEPIRRGKPDSVLKLINEVIGLEPALKYAPKVAYHTFSSLLKTNKINEAYEYGKIAIKTPTYEEPSYDVISNIILEYSDKMILPPKIYELGVEALQIEIGHIPYPELVNIPLRYHKIAKMYWLAGKKRNAIETEQQAIDILKTKREYSKALLAEYEKSLSYYNNM